MAVWLSALATMAAVTLFSTQPAAAAEEEWIILSFHDGSGVVRDAVATAADNGDRVVVVTTKDETDTKTFYSSARAGQPEEGFDSMCAGVDFSEATWYGTNAVIVAGNKVFRRIIYRMGTDARSHGPANVSASTVQHGYFRYLGADESEWAPAGVLVRATGAGDPPINTQAFVCVVKATF
jgi:hypothetical protein